MKFDKSMLQQLAGLDDNALRTAIRMIAASSGIDLGNTALDPEKLAALRTAMRGATEEDLANAKRIFDGYSGS